MKGFSFPILSIIVVSFTCSVNAEVGLRLDVEKMRLHFEYEPENYYVLLGGNLERRLEFPLAIQLDGQAGSFFELSEFFAESEFFQVGKFSKEDIHDIDGDGMGDLFELERTDLFDPFVGDDAWPSGEGSYFVLDRSAFEFYSTRSDFPGAIQTREVKFLISGVDTDEPQLYFLNTGNVPFHYYFARDSLGSTLTVNQFSGETYFNDDRSFIAGSLVAHDQYELSDDSLGIYTMEFWPTDTLSFEHVSLSYQSVLEGMPFAKDILYYHAPGETQRFLYEEQKELYDASGMLVIPTEDLFENISYTALNLGVSFGRLVLADSVSTLSIRDIVIFDTIPNTLTHISGIITALPQTPLSHINLKAKQNKTPNAYVKGIEDIPEVSSLLGENIRFEVTADGYILSEATQEDVDNYFESVRPTETTVLGSDLSIVEIRPLSDIGFYDTSSAGAKAANVAELAKVLPEGMVPYGFTVPFSFYDSFMIANGFYDEVEAIMADERFAVDPDFRADALNKFRDRIRDDGVLPHWMLEALQRMHDTFPETTSLRCRSSTNNEDLPSFNGAGLYNSYTHHPDEGHISKSMKQVWASLWTYRAYEEREFYRIDHLSTKMGVLVHPNFSDEQVNGVAVTKNIFDVNWRGYYVNAQVGEDLVTNPEAESIPEEFLVASLSGAKEYEIQYVRYSNLVESGVRVLAEDQVFELADWMRTIQAHFQVLYDDYETEFAMEIEFKITEEGTLSIKQARPWIE